jgi:hypothetical protein
MFTSEELRAMAQRHRATAQNCADQKLREEYLNLARAYESLAEDRWDAEAGSPAQAAGSLPGFPEP